MPIIHAFILGLVQGLSEFLPISSSAHLILVPWLLGWPRGDESLAKAFDVALHLGTLVAVVGYFRRDLAVYIKAGLGSLKRRTIQATDERLAWLLLASAIPGALTGALFGTFIEENMDGPVLIAVLLIVFGLVLAWADRAPQLRGIPESKGRDLMMMGTGQALALAPGVSRSGVTMSVARKLNLTRESAARLSFLMSIPIIFGAVLAKGVELAGSGIPDNMKAPFVVGIVTAGVSGWLAIAYLLKLLTHSSFNSMVRYRIVLGTVVIIVAATGLR